jgi:hypothetical protein
MLAKQRPQRFSVLLDPDTGIQLPGANNVRASRKHVTLEKIADILRSTGAVCVVTFDQSDYRQSGLRRREQRGAKLHGAAKLGLCCFYYTSHAPFLFAFRDVSARRRGQKCLTDAGVPRGRLETFRGDTVPVRGGAPGWRSMR